jgi:ammonia channel protein AmtB
MIALLILFFLALFLLRHVGAEPLLPTHTIPSMAFFIFQGMFACITPGKQIVKRKRCMITYIHSGLVSIGFWIGGRTYVRKFYFFSLTNTC